MRYFLFVLFLVACGDVVLTEIDASPEIVDLSADMTPDISSDTMPAHPKLEPKEVLEDKTPIEMCKDLEFWLLWRGEFDCPEALEKYGDNFLNCADVVGAYDWWSFYYLCRGWVLNQASCKELIHGPTKLSCHQFVWEDGVAK